MFLKISNYSTFITSRHLVKYFQKCYAYFGLSIQNSAICINALSSKNVKWTACKVMKDMITK